MLDRKVEAVLFDMDGTLVDTEPDWFQAEMDYASLHGSHWSEEQAVQMVGKPLPFTAQALKEWTGSQDSVEEILDYIVNWMVQAVSSKPVQWRPGMRTLVEELKRAEVPLGLVTSSARPIAAALVKQIPNTFAVVVSADDVSELKPSPQPYQLAAKKLGVNLAKTVVIEDSPSGIAAGVSAGANVIAIPCAVELEEVAGAVQVGSAADLNIVALERLAEQRTGFGGP